jgi:rhodanese-related sulfurtransferase
MRLADGSVLLIDVREPNEFASGHIPGSVSFPLSDFDLERLFTASRSRSTIAMVSPEHRHAADPRS